MIEKLKDFIDEVQQFTADTKEKAEELRLKFLSRKGILNEIFAEFKNVAPTEKREYGQRINALKQLVEKKINEAQEKFEEQASKPNDLDITLPGPNYSLGSHHPITNVLNEIIEIFSRLDSQWLRVRRLKTTTTISPPSISPPNTPHAICRTPSL